MSDYMFDDNDDAYDMHSLDYEESPRGLIVIAKESVNSSEYLEDRQKNTIPYNRE
ncbi:2766_t:CDS:2 [Gigaspora rosea]|nr:2766_t:CDS:2 [Gigaspora rosea]